MWNQAKDTVNRENATVRIIERHFDEMMEKYATKLNQTRRK